MQVYYLETVYSFTNYILLVATVDCGLEKNIIKLHFNT